MPWELPSQGLLDRTHRLLTRLALGVGVGVAGVGAALFGPAAWAAEARAGGVAGLVLGAALLGLTGLVAVLLAHSARRAWRGPAPAGRLRRLRVDGTGRVAQGVLVPALAVAAGLVAWHWRGWPGGAVGDAGAALTLAGVIALLAFPALVAQRFVAAIPGAVLPEAPALARLLAVPVLVALAAGAVEALRAEGVGWTAYAAGLVAAGVVMLAAELVLRGLARWFQPPTDPARARAAIGSVVADLPGWLLRPGAVAEPLRTHFGLDFSRSWALSFLRSAALPAVVLTALVCWGLSGVVLLPLDGRGVYERFGEPAAVMGPGLHATLPWPMGRVRPVEFGVVHEIPLGPEVATPMTVAADAPAPADADRLWDQPHPSEADWLIAGDGTSGQSFQVMSADIRVLYRIGLTDADALHSLYGVADADTLVREAAGRTVWRFFAGRTLESVLDQRRERMARELQTLLEAALERDRSGLEVVSVTIEAVHPPAGAAAAYHGVQAAEIIATTGIATETGRAKGTASQARERAYDLASRAHGTAAETLAAADGDARRFAGDRAARDAGSEAFLLERYFQTVSAALFHAQLTILDHRVAPGAAPVIDLRPLAAAAKATGADDSD